MVLITFHIFSELCSGKYRVVFGIPEHVVNESWHQGAWNNVAFANTCASSLWTKFTVSPNGNRH